MAERGYPPYLLTRKRHFFYGNISVKTQLNLLNPVGREFENEVSAKPISPDPPVIQKPP